METSVAEELDVAVAAALLEGTGRAAEHEHWHRQLAQALFLQSEFDEAEAAVER